MVRRIIPTLVVVMAVMLGALASPSLAKQAEAQLPSAATIQSAASVPGLLTVTNVQVTGSTNGSVNATATIYAGASTTPVNASLAYQDSSNWVFTVQRNSAGSSYVPTSSTSLDINQVDGTITKASGRMSYQLVLHGYVMGDATVDMTAYIDSTGWVATTVVENLKIGGLTLTHASLEVSTIDAFAEITASLTTTGGNFDVDIKATRPGNATPGQYTLSIAFSGAELKGETSTFQVNSFAFNYDVTTPTSGCTTIDSKANMSVTIGSTTYSLNNVHVVITCSTLTTFEFSVTVSHYQQWDGVTKAGTLNVAWYGTPGTFTPQFADAIAYQAGFFGSVDLSASRTFSKKYNGRRFRRGVTIGIGFGATVYQPSPGAQYTGGALAGGYFDADRVSGAIGCGFLGTDFTCGGTLRLNPSWAGVYRESWSGL